MSALFPAISDQNGYQHVYVCIIYLRITSALGEVNNSSRSRMLSRGPTENAEWTKMVLVQQTLSTLDLTDTPTSTTLYTLPFPASSSIDRVCLPEPIVLEMNMSNMPTLRDIHPVEQ